MNWRVLVSAPYAMPVLDMYRSALKKAGCDIVIATVHERLSEEELLPLVTDVDGIICGDDAITTRVLEAAPRLKVISKWGTGIDSIDQDVAAQRGVAVYNTPNAFSEPVADTVLGYILMFARKLDVMNGEIREGRWQKPPSIALNETTIGVIGVGNCGKAVVRRAIAFGMQVFGNDVVDMPDRFLQETGMTMLSTHDLLEHADFVSLNPTLNPTSYHMINVETLSVMKSTAYLINTSRGPVIDESALAHALANQQIAGAALDVFETEPLPIESPLRTFPNCVLGAHNANSSPSAADRVHVNTIHNLIIELQKYGHGNDA